MHLDKSTTTLLSISLVQADTTPDALLNAIFRRVTWRPCFARQQQAKTEELIARLQHLNEVCWITDSTTIQQLAKLHHQSTVFLCQDPSYYREFYSWLRFSTTDDDPKTHDGLHHQALGISDRLAPIARQLLKPAWFSKLAAIKIDRLLISEKKSVLSAGFLLAIIADKETSAFDAGRHFYRTWLEITQLGLSACPMSALVDNPSAVKQCRSLLKLPENKKIINVPPESVYQLKNSPYRQG